MAVRFQSPNEQFFDSNGDPLSAGTLTFTVTGTSTPLDTYSDNALTTPNTNPVVLDSAGRAGNIFLGNANYKVVLKNSGGATIWTADPVAGGPANSLFSTITTKSGNYTLQTSDNGALIEFTATATLTMLASATLGSTFRFGVGNAGTGIVTINRAGADTFDTGLTSIKLGPGQSVLIQPDGVSKLYTIGRDKSGKGADIASASTLGLGEDGDYFHVTGTTTITAIEARPTGMEITLEFDGSLTLTHNATSLILLSGANQQTVAGAVAKFISESDGGNWRQLTYQTQPSIINNTIVTTGTTASPGLAENGILYVATGAGFTLTLPQLSTVINGYRVGLRNRVSSSTCVANRSSTDTIESQGTTGLTSITLPSLGDQVWFIADVTNSRWYIDGVRSFEGAEFAPAASTVTAQAHSLGVLPKDAWYVLRNKTAELGYSVGDEVMWQGHGGDGVTAHGHSLAADATNLTHLTMTVVARVQNKGTAGAYAAITAANWKFVMRAVVLN